MNTSEKEYNFLRNSKNYLRAVQERVAAFFILINYIDIQTKVNEASDLWYKIIMEEAFSFYKLLYQKDFKDQDDNFMKRKGYRTKNQFAFDLITNWAFERSILSHIHNIFNINCSPFSLNPDSCDNDAKLGWGTDINKPRKINSKYDFITNINGELHNVELKSMFIHNRTSANFKVYFTPDKNEDLSKNHILFFNFNGIGNPRKEAPSLTTLELYNIPWIKLINCHIHYPPQLDSKPCYLVHLKGEKICELYNSNGVKTINELGKTNGCLVFDQPELQTEIKYSDLKRYLNYDDDKFNPDKMLNIIKEN